MSLVSQDEGEYQALHMRLTFVGEDEVKPDKSTITEAKKNDRTQLEEIVNESGVTYVFDRG